MGFRSSLLAFLFAVIQFSSSFAQCGVTPGLSCEAGGQTYLNINAGNTGFAVNWRSYSWKWEVNNQVVSTDSMISAASSIFLPQGYSLVCLTVSATDTVTQDSCTQRICNVFQSTGCDIFPELNVSSNGLTANASGNYIGGAPGGSVANPTIDWGDGTTSSVFSGSHTYANSGSYLVSFSLMDNCSPMATTYRKVQVGNGLQNMNVNPLNLLSSVCNPFTYSSAYSTPSYTSASMNLLQLNQVTYSQPMTMGTPVNFNLTSPSQYVPGQAVVYASINDINPSVFPIYRNVSVFFDVCGVVPDTIRGVVFNDTDADGVFDSNEQGRPNTSIVAYPASGANPNYSALTDANGFYELLIPNASVNVYVNGLSNSNTVTIPSSGGYPVNGAANNNFPNYNFGIAPLSTTIEGRMYLDFNHDSLFNGLDRGVANGMVKASNTVTGIHYFENTNTTGNYSFRLPSGTYVIRPASYAPLDSIIRYPDSIQVVANSGGAFYNRNFALYSAVNGNLGVRVFGTSEARPGFNFTLSERVQNTGFDTTNGTLVLSYDPSLSVVSSTPTGTVNTVLHTVTWPLGMMMPASAASFNVVFDVPPSIPLGTLLAFSTNVTPLPGYFDFQTANNNDTYSQTVVGSFDPNDKQCDPAGLGSTGEVLHGEKLHYRIRFQNTGTASAVNVVVQDTVDASMDMATFATERASHAYDVLVQGNVVTWKFSNIMLPDSGTNEPASHGFIEYCISPDSGLIDGTVVQNTAGIYFDFNAPVITNSTLHTYVSSLTSMEDVPQQSGLLLYPNPTDGLLQIVICNGQSIGPASVTVFDIFGREVMRMIDWDWQGSIEAQQLRAGSYYVRINAQGSTWQGRFMKL